MRKINLINGGIYNLDEGIIEYEGNTETLKEIYREVLDILLSNPKRGYTSENLALKIAENKDFTGAIDSRGMPENQCVGATIRGRIMYIRLIHIGDYYPFKDIILSNATAKSEYKNIQVNWKGYKYVGINQVYNDEKKNNDFQVGLKTLAVSELFIKPAWYIEPEEWKQNLLLTAFKDAHVHVISGERGIGKTLLARWFASECLKKDFSGNIRFRSVVFSSYAGNSLYETISFLSCKPEQNENFEHRIKMLEKLEKPALLIIDNYDKEVIRDEELISILPDILATGCNVLFTSRVNLSKYDFLRQTSINPLSLDDLKYMFKNVAKDNVSPSESKIVEELIKNFLVCNTYLVLLAARLTEKQSVSDIINAIKDINMHSNNHIVIGRENNAGPLMAHYEALFNMSDIDENKYIILYNLAMMPIEGMDYTRFHRLVIGDDRELALAFEELTQSYWIFLQHRTVTMHPLVRDMLANRPATFCYSYVSKYLKSLVSDILLDLTPEYEVTENIERGLSVIMVSERLHLVNYSIACIFAVIASEYDLMKEYDKTYSYGCRALEYLNLIIGPLGDDKCLYGDEEWFCIARAYNITGYGLLHCSEYEKSFEKAEDALLHAMNIVKEHGSGRNRWKNLKTKIIGNNAALYLNNGEYGKAYEIHDSNAIQRIKYYEEHPYVQNAALVGNSFCGMATAKLADFINGTGCQSSLEAAYDLFEKAIEYYGRAFDRPHRDMINAYNKLVSCWVRIVDIKPAAFIADKAEQYMQVMLKNIYDVLGATDINKKEVIRSADNIVCILRHTKKQGCVDRDMIAREIIPVFEMIQLMGDDMSLGIVHAFEELCLY